MKKSLLLTLLAAGLALTASAFTTQSLKPAYKAERQQLQAREVGKLNALPNKAPKKVVEDVTISSFDDIYGTWVGYGQDYFNDYNYASFTVTITADEEVENGLIISGLWGSFAEDVKATLDLEAGTITIPGGQLFYEYEGYTSANFQPYSGDDVVLTVYSNMLYFKGYWGAKLVDGSGWYGLFYGLVLQKPNGKMEYTDSRGTYDIPVLIYQDEDSKMVSITNFDDFGVDVNIDLYPDASFEITPQLVNTYLTRNFYTYAVGTSLIPIISGSMSEDATKLVFGGNWTEYDTTSGEGYWYGLKGPATITLLAGTFELPEAFESIAINEIESNVINVGATLELTAATETENAVDFVQWSSSDEEIATVDDKGVVTGVAPGTVTIKAASQFNPQVFDEIEIEVKLFPSAINISIEDGGAAELLPGESLKLIASVEPQDADDEIEWSSSDETVATVDENGLVTALTAEEAADARAKAPVTDTAQEVTITAASKANPDIKGEIVITVKPKVTGVNTIDAAAGVVAVKYVNAQGIVSNTAFNGLNIVVKTMSDGSQKTTKVVF